VITAETTPRGPGSPAPAASRLVAFAVDAALAVSAAAALRLAWLRGDLPFVPGPGADAAGVLQAPSTWIVALLLAALRDVPLGAGLGKWLLCLRVTNPAGGRLALPFRLARVPFSLLPLEWLAGERRAHVPWRVMAYAPGRAGFALRVALALLAAAWSLTWGVASVRPSIGRSDAAQLVDRTLARDPALGRSLGEPLQFEIAAVAPRSRTGLAGERGEFGLRVRGTAGRQEMVVHALRVDGLWMIDEVVDIRATRLAAGTPPDTLVAR